MADENKTDPVEEQSVEPERPEWLPEKFKSEEDFAKSYSELENRLREQGEERNNLEAQLTDLYGRVQTMEEGAQKASYDPSTDPTLLAYQQAMENGDYQSALAIQVGVMKQVAQQRSRPAAEGASRRITTRGRSSRNRPPPKQIGDGRMGEIQGSGGRRGRPGELRRALSPAGG